MYRAIGERRMREVWAVPVLALRVLVVWGNVMGPSGGD